MGIFTRPFVVSYNGLSLIAIPSLDIVLTFFHIIIKVQSDLNKLNRFMSVFTQCVHALVDARQKRHFKFELYGDQIGIFPVFKPSEKILKIRIGI